jgi:hypothetical protein
MRNAEKSKGGHDRIHPDQFGWGCRLETHTTRRSDGLIVNLGKAEYVGEAPPDPKSLEGWHCDGDVSAAHEWGGAIRFPLTTASSSCMYVGPPMGLSLLVH